MGWGGKGEFFEMTMWVHVKCRTEILEKRENRRKQQRTLEITKGSITRRKTKTHSEKKQQIIAHVERSMYILYVYTLT